MAIATIFSVQMLAYVQMETPTHLVGKVISLAMAVSMCSQPVGQAVFGILFDQFKEQPYAVAGGSLVITILLVLFSRRVFHSILDSGGFFIQEMQEEPTA